MDVLIGIKFDNFVLLAADMTTSQSILVMKTDENKIHKLSDKVALAVGGDKGDVIQFSEYVSKTISLYKLRNGYDLSPKSCAAFTRDTLATALRGMSAYHVNSMLAGFDEEEGPQLFYIDHMAAMADMRCAVHGFGGLFSLSIMDRYYLPNMTREEGYELLKKCIHEIHERLVVNLPNFKVQVVDKNGIHNLPPITAKGLATQCKTVFFKKVL